MASQHIEISSTASRFSAQVRRFVDSLRIIHEDGESTNDILQQIASGGDFASLATSLGNSIADAEIVYNLLVAVDLNTPAINAVIDRLG